MASSTFAMAGKRSRRSLEAVIAKGVPERHYRPELHGVRGVAILGVVLFHLFGAGRISGGIDIFLASIHRPGFWPVCDFGIVG
ncbi:hypothetical protein [Citricoccus nitrophenolicus]|uniref:hypothetical protein n=1 Tax=Citricoccus nitrophenolicus TaxID=863575 RepID=UPI0031EE0DB3